MKRTERKRGAREAGSKGGMKLSYSPVNIREDVASLARGDAVAQGTTLRVFVEKAVLDVIARHGQPVEPVMSLPSGRRKKAVGA